MATSCLLIQAAHSHSSSPLGRPQRDDAEARAGVLATNISSLYTTAKLEIARKDDEIKELRGR